MDHYRRASGLGEVKFTNKSDSSGIQSYSYHFAMLIGVAGTNGVGKGVVIQGLMSLVPASRRLSSTKWLMQYFGILPDQDIEPQKLHYEMLGQISQEQKLAAFETSEFKQLLTHCAASSQVYFYEMHLAVPIRNENKEIMGFREFLPDSYLNGPFSAVVLLTSDRDTIFARRDLDEKNRTRSRGIDLVQLESINTQDSALISAWERFQQQSSIPNLMEIENKQGELDETISHIYHLVLDAKPLE